MNNTPRIIIAIDGFSSCGKSTMAKELARHIDYTYIDSGAMYRAVTLHCLRQNLIDGQTIDTQSLQKEMEHIKITFATDPRTGKQQTYLNGQCVESEIRTMRVSNHVSLVSKIAFVRQALVSQQRELGKQKGIVMDGRDIGTAVFPQAELKIFVTASARTRAQRRADEMQAAGETVNIDDIEKNITLRDQLDLTREISPLRKADDAIELDNSNMSIDEQNQWLLTQFDQTIKKLTSL